MKTKRQLSLMGLGLAGVATAALLAARAQDASTIRRLRGELERTDGDRTDQQPSRFAPEMVADLPEPVRRYFLHAIRSGAPLARAVRLTMAGEMRLGPGQAWLPFRACQVLAPSKGFVWEASVGEGLMRFSGADTYAYGRGRVTFRLWDLIPVARAGGPDVSRSARGRLAIESIWQPAALLPQRGVRWTAIDDQTARATVTIDGEPVPLTVTIAPDGRLLSVRMERWGNLMADGRFAPIPFGADITEETSFGGYSVPSQLSVRWWYGTSRAFEFFHARLTRATYLRAGFATHTQRSKMRRASAKICDGSVFR